jgi:hypothetical protein
LRYRSPYGEGLWLPSAPATYGTVEELDTALISHIRRHVSLPAPVLPLMALYVRYTWLADRSRTAPYLRFIGLWP